MYVSYSVIIGVRIILGNYWNANVVEALVLFVFALAAGKFETAIQIGKQQLLTLSAVGPLPKRLFEHRVIIVIRIVVVPLIQDTRHGRLLSISHLHLAHSWSAIRTSTRLVIATFFHIRQEDLIYMVNLIIKTRDV